MLSTTELFVEHIISGILSLVWILAFMFCFIGFDPEVFVSAKEYWPILLLVTTSIAYPIGIFVDTIADLFLARLVRHSKRKHGLSENFSFLLKINNETPANTVSYFTYNRFKTRVARSSFLNFAFIGITVALFQWCQGAKLGVEHPQQAGWMIFVTFSLLAVIAFILWRQIVNAMYKKAYRVWGDS